MYDILLLELLEKTFEWFEEKFGRVVAWLFSIATFLIVLCIIIAGAMFFIRF